MGALTVQKIMNRVRRQFGDTAGVQLDAQFFYDFINDAMREIVLEADLLQTTATNNSVANTATLALPTDALRIYGVSYAGSPISEVELSQARQLLEVTEGPVSAGYPVGTPAQYWIWNNNIVFYPAPDSVKSVAVYYNRNPTEVSSTADIPELPARYDNRILEYLMAKAAEFDDDMGKYQVKIQEFSMNMSKSSGEDGDSQELYPFISVSPVDASYYDY
jgi:hypothetical protein